MDVQATPGGFGLAMVIDDENVDHMVFDRIAQRTGLVGRTKAFSGAHDALAFLRDNPGEQVNLILLDVNMPRMSGLEFLKVATQEFGPKFADACHVMLTTALSPRDREIAEGFEVVKGFIDKPLTAEALKAIAPRMN